MNSLAHPVIAFSSIPALATMSTAQIVRAIRTAEHASAATASADRVLEAAARAKGAR